MSSQGPRFHQLHVLAVLVLTNSIQNLNRGEESLKLGVTQSQHGLLMELADQMRIMNHMDNGHATLSAGQMNERCQNLLDQISVELRTRAPKFIAVDPSTRAVVGTGKQQGDSVNTVDLHVLEELMRDTNVRFSIPITSLSTHLPTYLSHHSVNWKSSSTKIPHCALFSPQFPWTIRAPLLEEVPQTASLH